MEEERQEEARQTEIMDTHRDQVSAHSMMLWRAIIAKDLGIPYHTVGMPEFEEWHQEGFCRDYEWEKKFDNRDNDERVWRLAVGSGLRKGAAR